MKTCFIQQPSGLGDILLTIKIGHHFSNLGYNVIWPILSTYNYINKYIFPFECEIKFVDILSDFYSKDIYINLCNKNLSEIYEDTETIFVPISNSSKNLKNQNLKNFGEDFKNMIGKFEMCNLNSKNWQNYFSLLRNYEEEEKLFQELKIHKKYHLINREFGTPPFWNEKLDKFIQPEKDLQEINMKVINGFSIFSWCGVFQSAEKIDTVSTSNFYLFEKIDLKCTPTIYSRNHPERSYQENFNWMHYLTQKQYNFVC